MKKLTSIFVVIFALFQFATVTRAGGGPVQFEVTPDSSLNPGEQYVVNALVTNPQTYSGPCRNCLIKLTLENAQPDDYIAQSSQYTDNDGRMYAKVISKISGPRILTVSELRDETGSNIGEVGSYTVLNYSGIQIPKIIYPLNGQTLDLEGAYMFKVEGMKNVTGYLFSLFQDGQKIYENYRDSGTLSANGEFALWESNPYHSKFHEGQMEVAIQAYVNGNWSNPRLLTIYLKPRNPITIVTSSSPITSTPKPIVSPKPTVSAPPKPVPTSSPIIQPNVNVTVDSSASAELQKRVNELENKLAESQEKQSALEQKLNDLIEWIKSIFPFFN